MFQPGIMGLSHSLSCVILLSARHVRICDGRTNGRTHGKKAQSQRNNALLPPQCSESSRLSERQLYLADCYCWRDCDAHQCRNWVRERDSLIHSTACNAPLEASCVGFGLCGLKYRRRAAGVCAVVVYAPCWERPTAASHYYRVRLGFVVLICRIRCKCRCCELQDNSWAILCQKSIWRGATIASVSMINIWN